MQGPRDVHQRMLIDLGIEVARELGLAATKYTTAEYIALARHTMRDYALSDARQHPVLLIAMGRAAGVVDDATLTAEDTDKIAERISTFLETEFKDEIAVSNAAVDLAQLPPPPTRQELANALLRDAGVDPDAKLDGSDAPYAHNGVAAFSPPLIINRTAGEYYFNKDSLTAEFAGRMKMQGGGSPTADDIQRIMASLPASLQEEFDKRFDGYKVEAADLLSKWVVSRLAAHTPDDDLDPTHATVTLSRARIQYYTEEAEVYNHTYSKHDKTHTEVPARGFVVSLQPNSGPRRHFYLAENGALHPMAGQQSAGPWLSEHRDEAFAAHIAPEVRGIRSRIVIDETGTGAYSAMADWLPGVLQSELETGRDAARGQTPSESATAMLLDQIPGWAMIMAIAKGDWRSAVLNGAIAAADVLPSVITGIRWAAKAFTLAKVAKQGASMGLRAVAGATPTLRASIKAVLSGAKAKLKSGLRPLDLEQVATGVKSAAPRLADDLRAIASRQRDHALPDGVWKIADAPAAPSAIDDAIAPTPIVRARNQDGDVLALLPYGSQRAGDANAYGRAFTQVDQATGGRIGPVLVADDVGGLHQTLPVDALERYRVKAPDTLQSLGGRRAGPDGTIMLDGIRYVRIGEDYIQVMEDAASSAGRRVWRAAPPEGTAPDVLTYRLTHDADSGLWRQSDAPGLKGGGRTTTQADASAAKAVAAGNAATAGLAPTKEQQGQYLIALCRNIRGNVTDEQRSRLALLLLRIGNDPRGDALLRAMTAWHKYVGEMPEIVLRQQGIKGLSDKFSSLLTSKKTWDIDPAALSGVIGDETVEAAIKDLGRVYGKLTQLSKQGSSAASSSASDRLAKALADGKVPLRKELDDEWTRWANDSTIPMVQGLGGIHIQTLPFRKNRYRLIDDLRAQLQKTKLLGGTREEDLKRIVRGLSVDPSRLRTPYFEITVRAIDDLPPLPADLEYLRIRVTNDAASMGTREAIEIAKLPRGDTTVMDGKGNIINGTADAGKGVDVAAGTQAAPPLAQRFPASLRAVDVEGDIGSVPASIFPPSVEVRYGVPSLLSD